MSSGVDVPSSAREPRPPMRLPRALVLACAAMLVGAASHALTSGSVSLVGAGAALPVLAALAWPLTARERSWAAILGVQLVGQQAAHVLFELGENGHHAAVPAALPVDAWFYGHVGAAVAASAWLRHGERRAWTGARRAAAALTAAVRALLTLLLVGRHHGDGLPVALPSRARIPLAPRRPLRHSVVRRGPPLPA